MFQRAYKLYVKYDVENNQEIQLDNDKPVFTWKEKIMSRTIYALKESGRKKVKIADDGYGLEFYTMRNGYQWSGFGVDIELLVMMRDAIDEYFNQNDNQKI